MHMLPNNSTQREIVAREEPRAMQRSENSILSQIWPTPDLDYLITAWCTYNIIQLVQYFIMSNSCTVVYHNGCGRNNYTTRGNKCKFSNFAFKISNMIRIGNNR